MALSIKKKLIFISALTLMVACSSAYISKSSFGQLIAESSELLIINNALRNHMESDMMHDAIRADMVSVMYALETQDHAALEDLGKDVKEHTDHIEEMVSANLKLELPADIKAALENVLPPLKAYIASARRMYETSKQDKMAAQALYPSFKIAFSDLEGKMGEVSDLIEKAATEMQKNNAADAESIVELTTVLSLVSLFLIVMLPLLTNRLMFIPLTHMMTAMDRITKGDITSEIPYTERRDEMGDIARTVQVFKDNSLKVISMHKEQELQKIEAEKQKRAAMHQLADKFEASVKGIVGAVAAAATELSLTSEGLVRTMNETSQTVSNAASGATQTVHNVHSVASAAEEMTVSVQEISSQLQNSNSMVQDSVKKAESADSQAIALSEATSKVREVISLISSIAGQINLLALNATIESARAGEAGRGFAVVASEVKNLASQTDHSVQEIERVIQEMNLASEGIIVSLKDIKTSIQHISGASSSIASAVEEQSATTNEIARNAQSAARATGDVSDNLTEVSKSSYHAETSASEVLVASQELSRQAEQLSREVDDFLHTIRAS